jgi:hypothetical protein
MTTPIRIVAEIEGAESLWCTSAPDEGAESDDRVARAELSYGGIKAIERCDIKNGKLEGESITLQIAATTASNSEFGRAPRLLTFLSDSLVTTGGTTLNVRSNSLLVDDDYVHIGTECLQIVDASTLAVTVARAQRGTQAQIHLRTDGADAAEIPVWSRVQAWEGRRVTLTAYEFGSSTVIMRGMISQPPYLNADGTAWLVGVDHIVKVLDQDVGVPSSLSAGIRGVKFGRSSAFGLRTDSGALVSLVGFYETEQEMMTAIGAEIDAASLSGVSDIWFTSQPSMTMFVSVGGANINQPDVTIGSNATGITTATDAVVSGKIRLSRWRLSTSGRPSTDALTSFDPMLANRTYSLALPIDVAFPTSLIYVVPGTKQTDYPWANPDGDAADETKDASIALDRDIGISVDDILILSGDSLPEDLRLTVTEVFAGLDLTYGFDADADDLLDYCTRNGISSIVLDGSITVRTQKSLGAGNLGDFLTAVVAAAPYANDGSVPYVTASDLDASTSAITARLAGFTGAILERDYNITEPASVVDVLAPELQLVGMMLVTDTSGRLAVTPYDVLSRTSSYDITIDDDEVVTPHGSVGAWPGWTPASDGIVSVVSMVAGKSVRLARIVRRGGTADVVYDPVDPRATIYRDVASLSAHKNRGVGRLDIRPEASAAYDLSQSDAVTIGSRITRFFGQPYEVITIKVRRSYTTVNARCGDVVLLTSAHVTNSGDGTRGVSNRRARIIGRTVGFDPADEQTSVVEFVLLMHGSATSGEDGANNVAGYAPSCLITAATLVISNTWDLTVAQNAFHPTVNDTDFFTVNDYVIAIEADDATPNTRTGLVVSKTATNVRVAFTAAAPWGGAFSGSYVLDFADVSYGMTDPQDDYCYTGDSTLLLSDGNPARIFA